MGRMNQERERSPHYTTILDPVEGTNPVTGRSPHFGARPWRCDDRVMDWLGSLTMFRWEDTKIAWRNFMSCAKADYEDQPTVPYQVLTRNEVMFYVDRLENGMIRRHMFEQYPFSTRDIARVAMQDGTKMRVWRHQRELELEAKQGRVEELISLNVTGVKPKHDWERSGGEDE